eukprot:12846279-Heterocapsa_arctica.AAC.1
MLDLVVSKHVLVHDEGATYIGLLNVLLIVVVLADRAHLVQNPQVVDHLVFCCHANARVVPGRSCSTEDAAIA